MDPTAMSKQIREGLQTLKPSTDKQPWPSQTIQKMDMAQPRWETSKPD